MTHEIIHLQKPKGRRRVEIVTDAEDDWFLHVRTIEKSTGEVHHSSMIIRKDLEGWVRYLESEGWKQVETTKPS